MEFKFATDRRMTAHVLSNKAPASHKLISRTNIQIKQSKFKENELTVIGKLNIHSIFE